MISEDDTNNSFLQKSDGQDETTEKSRRIHEHSTKIKDILNTNQGAINQQKKREKFPRHQKDEIKQQKTKQAFLIHATGKVQQPRTTKDFA